MTGRKVGFAKQNHDHGMGMALPDLGQLVSGVAIARPDLAQIFAGHAVQPVDRVGMLARGHQQFVKRRPVVSPVEIEADALLQFFRVDFAPPPFVENVLVAGENGFEAQHDRTVAGLGAVLEQSRRKTLGRRQSVVVADQDGVGAAHAGAQFLPVDDRFVGAEGLAEVPQILSPAIGIVDPDLAFHPRQGVQLRFTAPQPQVGGRCHIRRQSSVVQSSVIRHRG